MNYWSRYFVLIMWNETVLSDHNKRSMYDVGLYDPHDELDEVISFVRNNLIDVLCLFVRCFLGKLEKICVSLTRVESENFSSRFIIKLEFSFSFISSGI